MTTERHGVPLIYRFEKSPSPEDYFTRVYRAGAQKLTGQLFHDPLKTIVFTPYSNPERCPGHEFHHWIHVSTDRISAKDPSIIESWEDCPNCPARRLTLLRKMPPLAAAIFGL